MNANLAFDYAPYRLAMVEEQIVARGISNTRLLEILRTIPRERFLPTAVAEYAYADRALSIGLGQTISQPFIVAYMTDMLRVEPTHRVLEVGTGTGYQTAVLAALAREVFTLERIESLSREAASRLALAGIENIAFRVSDGSLGWPEQAPFDRIMVTAAAPRVPQCLVDQLADDGRMILPVGDEGNQQLVRVERSRGRMIETPLLAVRFVPLVGAAGFAEGF